MDKLYDVIIVGAGPGGLQTALTLKELADESNQKLNLLIIESGKQAGTFFTKYPVHGQLISNNKLYTGKPPKSRYAERFDWNSLVTKEKKILMRNYSRDFFPRREALVEMLNDLVAEYELPVMYNTTWQGTRQTEQGHFEVVTDKGTLHCKYLVVATGMTPNYPPIPGLEHTTPYSEMKKKDHYRDKRVLIIGKGNSGMECAQEILNEANLIMIASRHSTRLAYKTHYVGDVRAVNALLVDNYQLKHQAALLDCEITNIEKVKDGFNVTVHYMHAEDEKETLFFNEIIAATGFRANIDHLVKDLNLQIVNNKYPSISGVFESTEVPNLFFAGTQTHGLDYRKTFSGFIHGFRYNSKVLAHKLAERLGYPTNHPTIPNEEIVSHILEELTEAADPYLQPGFIVYVLRHEGGVWKQIGYQTIHEYESTPLQEGQCLLAASLEYGDIHRFTDPLSIPRVPGEPKESVHIHPVIRVRNGQNVIEKLDLEEHLENQFMNLPTHHQQLQDFLNTQLGKKVNV
ncbi:NAD(P)-binding domain-containing protein [Laceyella sacchari]|uniref:NAD(P)-binding domain-containing protein n=1 Tax=Laceyella sacchari TaxID=37482 RepID=A0ABY5TYA8_LACSH|nr:NAD(P)-binding domain-containing protein [Laceyella sacchari]TCW41777.1 thioredoxin reductase [Laceyella sacchari]UWE02396.1 NAD(P)-binding domain-containing protein [Laceyella sacchari]